MIEFASGITSYHSIFVKRPTDTIFQESWWLDTVAPAAWSAHEFHDGGELKAWMPLVDKPRAMGVKHFGMPHLTQTLGPWIQPVEGVDFRRIGRIHDYTTALITSLPKFDYFSQNAHYALEDILPFHWSGFEAQVRYTYVLDALDDQVLLWQNLSARTRRSIRKAEKLLKVRTLDNFEIFLELYEKTFRRQDMKAPVDERTLRRVYDEGTKRNAVKILVAEDASGKPHGVVFLLYDHRTTYYLMGGSDPRFRDSQSLSLLLWEAIKFSGSVSKTFDFEGSMIANIESFFRNFGGKRRLYYSLSKMSNRFAVAWSARSIFKRYTDTER